MRTPARMAEFAAVLGVSFGAAAIAGGALDPLRAPGAGPSGGHGGDEQAVATPVDEEHVPPGLAAGAFVPQPLPSPALVDEAGGYRAKLSAEDLKPDASGALAYDLSRDGRPLGDIEPYLGAEGHLVALREGDLAFLHVHREESDMPGRIRFAAELPSAGRYRLFLQFKRDGAVRTVAHTLEVSP